MNPRPFESALVVDDNKNIRISTTIHLSYILNVERVDAAENGRDGLLAILNQNPDLIITGHNMPEMTGLEMLEGLKNEGWKSEGKEVVFCSTRPVHEEIERLFNLIRANIITTVAPKHRIHNLNRMLLLLQKKSEEGAAQIQALRKELGINFLQVCNNTGRLTGIPKLFQ